MAGLYSFRSQCDLTDPQTPTDALISEAKHISNLRYIVWMKMKNFVEYEYGNFAVVSVKPLLKHITK